MANEYADEKYYQPNLAIPSVTKNSKGKETTTYLDINTGQEIKNLDGYTIYDGTNYYDPSKAADTNVDGKINSDETTSALGSSSPNGSVIKGGSTREDAIGHIPGQKGTVSNNFGYTHKPGYMGALGMAAGLVNPGLGAVVGLASKAVNIGNMDAVNSARKGLGLSPLSAGGMLKGAMKDNKGQVANVNIGDKKYSVGFEAVSPDNKTNLTYSEAKTREALARTKITETPKNEVTPSPKDKTPTGLLSKVTGLEKGWLSKAVGLNKAPETPKDETPKDSLATKVTGLQKGWLSKALTDLTTLGKVAPETAATLPDLAPTPTPRPENIPTPTPRPEDLVPSVEPSVPTPTARPTPPSTPTPTVSPSRESMIGLPDQTTATPTTNPGIGIGPSQANPLGIGAGSVGFMGKPNSPVTNASKPGVIDASVPDRIGRVGLMSVDFGKMGLQPAMAAQMKSFQDQAVQAGIADKLSVDVTSAVRTQKQQDSIKAAGFSKTKNSYHQVGLAVDVSPTAINDKDQITDMDTLDKSRAIAAKLGLGTLNPAIDPAHIQAQPGISAKALKSQPIDPATGLTQLTPEQDLNTRVNSVPTPTARPAPSVAPTSLDKSFDSQVGLNAPSTPNDFGTMKNDMSAPKSFTSVSNTKAPDTPAGLAAMGFTARTPAEKAQMARTIAGELGQTSLKALASTDPVARAAANAEVGSIVATMENRAATTKYAGTVAATQTPSQYNSLMDKNATVTNQNFANNPAVAASVDSAYAGYNPDVNYGATNYHATAMTNPPGWSSQMTNPSAIGQHTFGHLPGFTPSPDQQSRLNAFGTMAGTNFSPGKAKDDMGIGASSVTTGLGKPSTPGYGGPGLGYSGVDSGAKGSVDAGKTDKSSDSSKSDSSSNSSSSSSSSSGSGSSQGGVSNSSKSTSSSLGGGYKTDASKGSTGGL